MNLRRGHNGRRPNRKPSAQDMEEKHEKRKILAMASASTLLGEEANIKKQVNPKFNLTINYQIIMNRHENFIRRSSCAFGSDGCMISLQTGTTVLTSRRI